MALPPDLRSRFEALSKDGKKAVLRHIDSERHRLEIAIHEEEKKDYEAKVDNAEHDDDTPPPFPKK